jgi:hypothetical protein
LRHNPTRREGQPKTLQPLLILDWAERILRHNFITASFNDQKLRAFDKGSIRFDEVPLTNVFQFIHSPE